MNHDLASQSIQTLNLTAGIDWLTLTVKQPKTRGEVFQRFNKLRGVLRGVDRREKRFAWHGYVGLQVAGLRWGTRPDTDILIMSGAAASSYWKLFARLADNVTRLDMAVTATVFPPIPRLTSTYYENLNHGTRKWAEIRSEEGGNTLYVGKRISDQFGRIYDKGLQADLSAITGAIWRYEIEYKGDRANTILTRLLTEVCPGAGITPLVVSHTYNWFDARNIPPVFAKNGNGVIESHVKVADEDDERTLTWFRTQVSPALKRLIGHRRTDVLEALGLEEADQMLYGPSI